MTVEKTCLDACKRLIGLKLMKDLMLNDAPWNHTNDLIQWFSSGLRQNGNKFAHFKDDLIGQGDRLENLSRKNFFEIIGYLVQRLKDVKEEKQAKVLLNALKWKFTGRDHSFLANLSIF